MQALRLRLPYGGDKMKKTGKFLIVALMLVAVIGACFAFTACNQTKAEKVKVIDIELTAEDYAFCVNKSNTALVEQANAFLAQIKSNGTLENIINSFFNGNATFTYENPAGKDGCLVVATNAYFPPFEYFSGNKFTGVDMQIAKLLADYLGKPLYIDDMEFEAVTTSVQQGKADIGMAGLTVTEERLEILAFTDSYYSSAQVIVVKESDALFDNCHTAEEAEAILAQQTKSYVIGAQNGTTGFMYSEGSVDYGYDGFPNLTTTGYTTDRKSVV